MKKTFFNMNDVGNVFLWCVLAPQILGFVAQCLLIGFVGGGEQAEKLLNESKPLYITFVMLAQIAFIIVFLYFTRKNNVFKSCKINTKFGWKNFLICIAIGICGAFLLSPISTVGSNILTGIGYNMGDVSPFAIDSPLMLVVALVLICGVPAVVEELIFRGVIMQGLRKYGDWVAIFGSAGLFALIHASATQFIFPLLFGVVLGYMVIKTGSLVASMLIHFVSNAITACFIFFKVDINIPIEGVWFVLLAIACWAVFWCLAWFLGKIVKNVDEPKKTEEVLAMLDNAEQVLLESGNDPADLLLAKNSISGNGENGENTLNGENTENGESQNDTNNQNTTAKQEYENSLARNSSSFKLGIILGCVIWLFDFAYYMII